MKTLIETFENFKATFSPESVSSWGEHISNIKVNLTWDFQDDGLVLDGIGNNPYIFPGVSKRDVVRHYEDVSGEEVYSDRVIEEMMHDMVMSYSNDHMDDLTLVLETGNPIVENHTTKKYLNGQLI